MGQRFFPLDRRLGLLTGGYTPQVQEAMTRLGSRLSYKEAQEELSFMWNIAGCKATVCNTTMRYGHHNLAVEEREIAKLEEGKERPKAKPKQLVMSVDGAMVQLTTGEWREAKLAAFGEFESRVNEAKGDVRAKTETVSYFARMESSAEFERSALLEWHKRGGENAKRVVAVNDGAVWIQSFIDYHCPHATRVIDFAHAQGYLSTIGKLTYTEGSEAYKTWFAKTSKQLGTNPPSRTLNDLRFLQSRQTDGVVQTEMDVAIRYLETRQEMIDYPRFRRMQIPIGSGMSESGHKVVMQRRMKQAGMRWAEHNVNAMLSLRTALCNGRWEATWKAITEQAQASTQKRKLSESIPQPIHHVDERPVTEKDCQQLERLKRRSRKGQKWQNHNALFPHRQPSLHRT